MNVSYDPTRELYREFNEAFQKHWLEKTGETVKALAAHGGSGAQSRSVINGQEADVVTLALGYDIDMIAEKTDLISDDWQKMFPNNNCPYTTTIIFLVRKGNPKGLKDWDDLIKEGIEIITPNPQTSGGARWNYLAAWGYSLKKDLGGFEALNDPGKKAEVDAAQLKAREFVKKMFKNVGAQDTGARAATERFVNRKQGDVLLAWENEAILSIRGKLVDEFEIVYPSLSILAEPPVALVSKTVDRRKTRDLAEAYLNLLYDPIGQEIVAKNHYRPIDATVRAKYAADFPEIELFTIDAVFGGWRKAQEVHFNGADAICEQIFMENAKE